MSAPTPPLEALLDVLSCAVTQFEGERTKTWAPKTPERMQFSFVDPSRAYFNGCVDPDLPISVELPPGLGHLPLRVVDSVATCTGPGREPRCGERSTAVRFASLASRRAAQACASCTTLSVVW